MFFNISTATFCIEWKYSINLSISIFFWLFLLCVMNFIFNWMPSIEVWRCYLLRTNNILSEWNDCFLHGYCAKKIVWNPHFYSRQCKKKWKNIRYDRASMYTKHFIFEMQRKNRRRSRLCGYIELLTDSIYITCTPSKHHIQYWAHRFITALNKI